MRGPSVDRNKVIALVVSIILGFFAVVAVKMYIDQKRKLDANDSGMFYVLVARNDLQPGQEIVDTELTTKYWTEDHFIHSEMFSAAQKNELVNKTLNRPVKKNEPILKSYLEKKIEMTGVSSPIESKWRAVTIPVTEVTGVSGLIRPNDYVDIIWTTGKMVKETRVLLSKVMIIAVGQQFRERVFLRPGEKDTTGQYSTVTLKVCPEAIGLIDFARQTGSLTLALRNRNDTVFDISADRLVEGDKDTIEKVIKEVQQKQNTNK